MRRAGRSSAAGPRAVQGHVALNLRHRRAHVREQELRGVVRESLATPQEDAEEDQSMAALVRAQVHGCFLEGLDPAEGCLVLDHHPLPLPFYSCSRAASLSGSCSGASLLIGRWESKPRPVLLLCRVKM